MPLLDFRIFPTATPEGRFLQTSQSLSGFVLHRAVALAGVGLVYLLMGKAGLALAYVHPNVSPFWPAAGVALGCLLVMGRWVWPAIWIGALVVNLSIVEGWSECLLIATGNTLSYVTAAWMLTRWGAGGRSLERPISLFGFLGVAAVLMPAMAAGVGVASVTLLGDAPPSSWRPVWTQWFLGDSLGMLTMTPLLMSWSTVQAWRFTRREWVLMGAWFTPLLMVVLGAYGGVFTNPAVTTSLPYLLLPLMAGLAFSLGPRGASAGFCTVAWMVVWGTSRGYGPSAELPPRENLVYLQGGLLASAVMVYLVSAIMTQFRQAQAALRGNFENLKQLFDAAYEAMVVHENGGIRDVNQTFVDMFHCPREEAVGRPLAVFCPSWEGEVLQGGRAEPVEVACRDRRGEELMVEMAAAELDYGGRPATLVSMRDITPRKRMERALEEKEEQVRQMQKLESLGQLAGGVAHEFNNLLTGVSGYAQLMQLRLQDEPQARKHLQAIVHCAERGERFTRQLLDFSRKGKMAHLAVNLHERIHAVANLLRHTIDRRIDIRLSLEAANPWVMGDPSQLESMLLNLALNARDAMPDGGTLTISTSGTGAGNQPPTLLLQVCDTGQGMDEETRRRCFEPFYTTKGVGKGSGLGLSAVYGCVKDHHGQVAVDSTPGKGTCFLVWLPSRAAPAGEGLVAATPHPFTLSGHVLVVDDEEHMRDVLLEMLGVLGCEVTLCSHGREALEALKAPAKPVDVVLLDMVMPEMSGGEVLAVLGRDYPWLKVVVCTGFIQEGETLPPGAANVSAVVKKPFRMQELGLVLQEVLVPPAHGGAVG